MNRIERLTAIVMLLQDRPHTSSQIARRFEVSKRTVLRDVQALCEMGVPVIAQDGLRGGYSLPPDYLLDPPALSAQESFLLLLALRGLGRLADAPFGAARASLLAKMRAALSKSQVSTADQWLDAVEMAVPTRGARAPFLDTLIAAAHQRQWLLAEYDSAERRSTQHLLPLKVVEQRGLWYCSAVSAEHGETRRYRVDRFRQVGPAEPGFVPPAGPPAGPAAAAGQAAPAYDDPAHPEVRATLTARGLAYGEAELEQMGPASRRADGGAELRFRCPPAELDWYARFFASLGPEAEVHAPPELRQRLAELGQGLVARYHK
jgi:predicted DNA-binding transcriptional regulator YafY